MYLSTATDIMIQTDPVMAIAFTEIKLKKYICYIKYFLSQIIRSTRVQKVGREEPIDIVPARYLGGAADALVAHDEEEDGVGYGEGGEELVERLVGQHRPGQDEDGEGVGQEIVTLREAINNYSSSY